MTEQTRSRIEQVTNLLRAGTTSRKIIDQFSVEWNVSVRTMERVIKVARTYIAKEREEEADIRASVRQQHYKEMEEIQIRNEKELNEILMNIARGVPKIKKVFNTSKGLEEKEFEINPDTVIRAINTIYKRYGVRIIEQQKEKENIEQPEPFLNWALEELDRIDEPKKSFQDEQERRRNEAARREEDMRRQRREEAVVTQPEEKLHADKEENVKETNPAEPVNEVKSVPPPKVNEPGTSTFNKWKIPFMPQQHYRRQQRLRVKNYPVKRMGS